MNEEMVTITKKEYDNMKKEIRFLEALRTVGVDNWEGYDLAKDLLIENEERYPEQRR